LSFDGIHRTSIQKQKRSLQFHIPAGCGELHLLLCPPPQASQGVMISVRTKSATFSFQFGVRCVDTEVWLSRAGQVPWFYSLVKALFLLSFALEESCSPLKTGHREDPLQRKDPAISLCLPNRIPSAHTQSPRIVILLLNHSKLLPYFHRFFYFKRINNSQATHFPDHAEKS